MDYKATLQFAYPIRGFWNVLVPLPKMFSIGSSFIGAAAVCAIAAAWFSKTHRVLVAVLSFVLVYFVLNGFGEALKLPRLTYRLPVLGSVRQLTSHYVFVVVSASVLISIGFDTILSMEGRKKCVALGVIIFAILVTAFIGLTTQTNLLVSHGQWNFASFAFIISPMLFGALLFVKPSKLQNG